MSDMKFRKVPLVDPHYLNIEKQKRIIPSLRFVPQKDVNEQRVAISNKLLELLKIPEKTVKSEAILEYFDTSDPRFDEYRFVYESEPGFFVPAHLLLPKDRPEKLPLVICLQGHSTGMHVSLGREAYPGKEPIKVKGDRDFGIQAVSRGYAALCMEQRGFGELNWFTNPEFKGKFSCHELVWQAAMMGKTLLGERLLDISCAIDACLASFDFLDESRIGIMGNSGGGTCSFYAASVDERIKVSMPSCAFCSFVESRGSIHMCDCGYVNGILPYMDMADIAILIAPRPLVIVSGLYDQLAPYEAVKKAFARVKQIYEAFGAEDNCRHITGPEGHRFYADLAWDTFDQLLNR